MIHLFCCIGVDEDITNLNLLYHFFDFYSRQGIDDFYIILQAQDKGEKRIAAARKILREFDVTEKYTWTGEYSSPQLYNYMLAAVKKIDKKDWIILADIDEFHNFPIPARQFLRECENGGANCIRGRILDKVASDGTLKIIEKDMPIDQQFPLSADITKRLAKANTAKIAAFKRPLVPGKGHHHIVKKKWQAKYWDEILDTHHFKWDSLVFGRIEKRYKYYLEQKIDWYKESERVYQYLLKYKQFIPAHFTLKKTEPLFCPEEEG